MLDPARSYGFGSEDGQLIPDIQLLAKLHGFGAATGFLDFALDPLAALWYACEVDDCDGRVFLVDLDSWIGFRRISVGEALQSVEEIFRWPEERGGNLYFETSVQENDSARELQSKNFSVQAWPLIPADAFRSVVIAATDKPQIRQELEEKFDYGKPGLLADLQRFSVVNSPRLPIPQIEDPEFSLLLGNQCYLQGDYPGAIAHYDKSVELGPDEDLGYFYYVRGNAKAAAGDLSGARGDYDLGLCYEERIAEELARRADGQTNKHRLWQLHYNRGNVRAELQDLTGALDDYGEAIRIGMHESIRRASSFLNRGNVNLQLCKFSEALRNYDEAIEAGSPFAHFNRGNVLVTLGRFDEALQSYDEAIHGGDRRSGVICNRNGVTAILNRIGGDGYIVDAPRNRDSSRRMIIEVSLRADSDNRYTEFFNFHGAKGNDGNIGGVNLPGGVGYAGNVGFVVVVKGEEW